MKTATMLENFGAEPNCPKCGNIDVSKMGPETEHSVLREKPKSVTMVGVRCLVCSFVEKYSDRRA